MSRSVILTTNQGTQSALPRGLEMKPSETDSLTDIFSEKTAPAETTPGLSSSLHQWSNTLRRRDSMDDLWDDFDEFFEKREAPSAEDNPSTISSGLQFLSNLFSKKEAETSPSEEETGVIAISEDFDAMADLEYISQLAEEEEEALKKRTEELFATFEEDPIATPKRVEMTSLPLEPITVPKEEPSLPPMDLSTEVSDPIILSQETAEEAPNFIEERRAVEQPVKKEGFGSFFRNLFTSMMDALSRWFTF